jgi:hypothetical protein
MTGLRHAFIPLWLVCGSFPSTVGRLGVLTNQIGSTRPGVAVAGAATAGAAGTAVAARGCQSAVSVSDDVAKAVLGTADDAVKGLAGASSGLTGVDDLAVAAASPARWATFSHAREFTPWVVRRLAPDTGRDTARRAIDRITAALT